MSFKLSRTQFLQMFAVMQSIKLINMYTETSGIPLMWRNIDVDDKQFATLLELLSSTPDMPSLKEMASGITAPLIIDPFAIGGYLRHSGPGIIVAHERDELNVQEDALFGAIDRHISTAFSNLARRVQASASSICMSGDAFCTFDLMNSRVDDDKASLDRSRLTFCSEVGDECSQIQVEFYPPPELQYGEKYNSKLIGIMRDFIGQSMIDASAESTIMSPYNMAIPSAKPATQTFEEKLLEHAIWGTW